MLSDIAWAVWHHKSPATRLLVQQVAQADNKKNIDSALVDFGEGFYSLRKGQ